METCPLSLLHRMRPTSLHKQKLLRIEERPDDTFVGFPSVRFDFGPHEIQFLVGWLPGEHGLENHAGFFVDISGGMNPSAESGKAVR